MANRSEQAISVTDNLPPENRRSKFAEILGKNLSLLVSSISFKSRGHGSYEAKLKTT